MLVRAKIVHWTISLPPRIAPKVRGLEIGRIEFATKLSPRQFEVGDKANFVRNSRNGRIWSVKHELLRFALQILSQPLTVQWTVKANQPLR